MCPDANRWHSLHCCRHHVRRGTFPVHDLYRFNSTHLLRFVAAEAAFDLRTGHRLCAWFVRRAYACMLISMPCWSVRIPLAELHIFPDSGRIPKQRLLTLSDRCACLEVAHDGQRRAGALLSARVLRAQLAHRRVLYGRDSACRLWRWHLPVESECHNVSGLSSWSVLRGQRFTAHPVPKRLLQSDNKHQLVHRLPFWRLLSC
jgi:hypothetical protein